MAQAGVTPPRRCCLVQECPCLAAQLFAGGLADNKARAKSGNAALSMSKARCVKGLAPCILTRGAASPAVDVVHTQDLDLTGDTHLV